MNLHTIKHERKNTGRVGLHGLDWLIVEVSKLKLERNRYRSALEEISRKRKQQLDKRRKPKYQFQIIEECLTIADTALKGDD